MAVTKNDIADSITLADAKNYVNALAAEILDDVKNNRISGDAINYADDMFLSEQDIVDAVQDRDIKLIDCDIDEVKDLRTDALQYLKTEIADFLSKSVRTEDGGDYYLVYIDDLVFTADKENKVWGFGDGDDNAERTESEAEKRGMSFNSFWSHYEPILNASVGWKWKRRKPGRPKKIGGRDVKVYLDDESIRLAKKFGGGSMSEGIRSALKYCKKHCLND